MKCLPSKQNVVLKILFEVKRPEQKNARNTFLTLALFRSSSSSFILAYVKLSTYCKPFWRPDFAKVMCISSY